MSNTNWKNFVSSHERPIGQGNFSVTEYDLSVTRHIANRPYWEYDVWTLGDIEVASAERAEFSVSPEIITDRPQLAQALVGDTQKYLNGRLSDRRLKVFAEDICIFENYSYRKYADVLFRGYWSPTTKRVLAMSGPMAGEMFVPKSLSGVLVRAANLKNSVVMSDLEPPTVNMFCDTVDYVLSGWVPELGVWAADPR